MPIYEGTFTGILIRRKLSRKVTLSFRVKAQNRIAAIDKVKKRVKNFNDLNYPTFIFGEAKKLQPEWLQDAITNAGPFQEI